MQEIWKDIQDFEGLYQVSSIGNVKRILFINNKVTKPKERMIRTYTTNGYKMVDLCKQGKYKRCLVHRLVATAFIDNPLQKQQVNHKDGNKSNNTVDNLEWCTQSENMKHAYKIGLKTSWNKNKKYKHKKAQ